MVKHDSVCFTFFGNTISFGFDQKMDYRNRTLKQHDYVQFYKRCSHLLFIIVISINFLS